MFQFFGFFCVFLWCATEGQSALKNDALSRSQRVLTNAMKVNNIRMRVAAENMANSKTVDYVPKSIHVQSKHSPKTNTTHVRVKKINRNKDQMVKTYDPNHPKADEQGMVQMPKIDPLMTMMDMQGAKLDNERAMRSYQMATDMRHRTIKMMNP